MSSCYPVTKPVRSASPTFEPVTLDEARRQCRLPAEVSYHDEDLTQLIAVAREQVERDTGIVCCTGTYTFKLSAWPSETWFEIPVIRPVTAVSAIAYVDTSGATTTWDSSKYVLDSYGVAPLVRLAYGESWPSVRGDINGIGITVTAGYASQSAIPARVKHAVLLLVGHWFDAGRDLVGKVGTEVSMTYEALIRGLVRDTYA